MRPIVTIGLVAWIMPTAASAQPAITLASTVGCAVKVIESGHAPRWILTRATEPVATRDPFESRDAVAEMERPLGSLTFQLDGVIEHISEADRQEYRRAGDFIVPAPNESAGQLRDGHKVALTGLFGATPRAGGAGPAFTDGARITITSVASLTPTCR